MHAIEIDGRAADLELLGQRVGAEVAYATTFLAVDGRVRGLDVHLSRLAEASRAPLGPRIDAELVEHAVRAFLRTHADTLSVRVELFHAADDSPERVLVMGREVPRNPVRPLRLLARASTRSTQLDRRNARAVGFGDLLSHDADTTVIGCPSGALGFVWRDRVIWPQAGIPWVEQLLLDEQLRAHRVSSAVLDVRLDDLRLFDSCFVVGHGAVSLVEAVDDITYSKDETALDRVRDAFADIPWQSP